MEPLVEQLRALGIEQGDVLLVHSSYRAVRPIVGGPPAIIGALRAAVGDDGTLVMPSWGDDDDAPFDAATTPVSASLGVTAAVFAKLPGVHRSTHPFAFSAMGPNASEIVRDTLPTPPHAQASPVGRVWELDGKILLLGVGHDSDTTIHLAEVLEGVPYSVSKHCTVMRDGRPTRVDYLENDHCCEWFALADDWLRAQDVQREARVGQAHARLVRSRDVVDVVRERLARDPLIFLHDPEDGCVECDEARRSVR